MENGKQLENLGIIQETLNQALFSPFGNLQRSRDKSVLVVTMHQLSHARFFTGCLDSDNHSDIGVQYYNNSTTTTTTNLITNTNNAPWMAGKLLKLLLYYKPYSSKKPNFLPCYAYCSFYTTRILSLVPCFTQQIPGKIWREK